MLGVGQLVMVIGDSRCPMGSVRSIASMCLCDFGRVRGIIALYRLDPTVYVNGMEMYFPRHHLMVLGEDVENAIAANVFSRLLRGDPI